MLENKTTEPDAAKGGKGRAKAAGTSPMSARATGRKAAAARSPQENLRERIQRRAYELWEIEGRPEGRAHAHWYQAEMEITRARSQRVGASG